jgi:hypothetical protein
VKFHIGTQLCIIRSKNPLARKNISSPSVPRKKPEQHSTSGEALQDKQALVSVPVVWFNQGPWREAFPRQKRSFIVAFVYKTDPATKLHEMRILGATNSDNFHMNTQLVREGQARWIAQGKIPLPSYEVGKRSPDHDDDQQYNEPSPKKYKGRHILTCCMFTVLSFFSFVMFFPHKHKLHTLCDEMF